MNSGNIPIESLNLASPRTSSPVRLYLKYWILMALYLGIVKKYAYLPIIFLESRVPIVIPKFLNFAFSNPDNFQPKNSLFFYFKNCFLFTWYNIFQGNERIHCLFTPLDFSFCQVSDIQTWIPEWFRIQFLFKGSKTDSRSRIVALESRFPPF